MRFNRQARAGYKYWPRVGVPVNMQHQFQQSLFMNPCVLQFINRVVDIPAAADLGTHSAHCAADRGLSQVQFFVGVYAPVVVQRQVPWLGRAENCGFRSCRFSGVRNAWFDCGYMFCIIQGGFWKNFTIFLVIWWTRDAGVNSRSLHTWREEVAALVVDSGSDCVYWFCL